MPKIRKRGAIETSTLVGLVTIAAFGLILFVFLKNTSLLNVEATAKETCKRSVQNHAKLKIGGVSLAGTETIKCPTTLETVDSSNDEKAKRQLAGIMYDCFDNFGAGELELFDTRRGSAVNYCVVCSKVTFTEKGKEIKGLADYLREVNAPGRQVTYYEFFKGKGEEFEAEKIVPLNSVDTSKDHAVLFTYGKTTGWWDKLAAGSIAGTAGLVVGGAVAGFFTGGFGWVVVGAAVAGGTGFGVAVAKGPHLDTDWQAGVIFIPFNEDMKRNLNCGEVPIVQ